MVRLSALFWLALVVISGFAMFKVKYTVQELDEELARVRKQTAAEQQEIRVLNAEWSYLTQPERLADLNRRFLALGPAQTKQFQHAIDEFPVRPLPPPEVPTAYAAAAPTAAPVAAAPASAPPAGPIPAAATPVIPPPAAMAAVASAPTPAPAIAEPPALPVTAAALKTPAGAGPIAKVQKAVATKAAAKSLNDLFAEIEGGR